MRNVNRRIETLEQSFLLVYLASNDDLVLDDELLSKAARSLSDEDLDVLIAATEAEKGAIPLTLRQIAARNTWERVIASCRES